MERVIGGRTYLLLALACLSVIGCSSDKQSSSNISLYEGEVVFNEPENPYTTISDNEGEDLVAASRTTIYGDVIAEWESLKPGLYASVGKVTDKYRKEQIPTIKQHNSWSGSAWRGERALCQIVLWSAVVDSDVRVEVGDLKDRDGNSITSSAITTGFAGYVLTEDGHYQACGYREGTNYPERLESDPIYVGNSTTIASNETRPVWISIDVPASTVAGDYSGVIEISSNTNITMKLNIELEVSDMELPKPSDWNFFLDLWQNPYSFIRTSNVEAWSDAHFDVMRPTLKRLAEAGQKTITTSIIDKPWNGQTFDHFEAMIEWRRAADGSWSYNYDIFDRWIQFMMDLGIDNQIHCYSMVPWHNTFAFFDEATGKMEYLKAAPDSREYKKHWTPFLTDFAQHLKSKGWFDICYLAMDERDLKDMKSAMEIIKGADKNFKVSLAGNYPGEDYLLENIDNYSIAAKHSFKPEDLKRRRENSQISTYYVCCSEEYPNNFTFSPSAEGTWQMWFAYAHNFDGFLRWAYNSWVEEPFKTTSFTAWPSGDTFLVYPENRTSIRFEMMREGIEDYEKLSIVIAKLKELEDSSVEAKQHLLKLENFLDSMELSEIPKRGADSMVTQGRSILKEASNFLSTRDR